MTKVDVRSEIDEILASAAAAIQITVERSQRQIAQRSWVRFPAS
ncbi:MAG TPA: hypothetical protein VN325_05630 [Steroidobacteraceae bacterium]|nr:hypothetical protein [Steroidobacteraceae bacterium]